MKAVGINFHLAHRRQYATEISTLGPGFRTSSCAVLARGTFENVVVTYNCTNTLYYRINSSGAPF